jgi:PucR C-terminal helix-turn-helix domain/GGDEF-like domain
LRLEPSVDAVRAGVVGRLRARRGELVEAIFRRIQAGAFAGAGDGDAEYLAGLRAAVAAAVDYALEGIEHDEEWAGPVPVATLEQTRREARAGVSLGTVLRRYVAGHTLFGEYVIEEANRGELLGERRVLRAAARAQATALDRLLAAITHEYGEELARAGRSPERRRVECVHRLLEGGSFERAELDYELGGWHLGVIAAGAAARTVVESLAEGVDRRLLSVSEGQERVWAWLGGRERFASAELEQLLGGVADRGVVVAFGEPACGIAGWRLTHRQARAALLVELRKCDRRGVTRYGEVALVAFALSDEMLAASLIELYLAPLDEQRDGGVISRETLRAYFLTGRNASAAAAALNVARHTVENRLRAVEESLGRALHTCSAELEVALALEQLEGFTDEKIAVTTSK